MTQCTKRIISQRIILSTTHHYATSRIITQHNPPLRNITYYNTTQPTSTQHHVL